MGPSIMLTLLLTSMLTFAFNILPARAEPKTWTVDDDGAADFQVIQEAINAVISGDTIYVYNGTYYEHLTITKNNLAITGENANNTIIDGSGAPMVVVDVDTSNNVKIGGFTIQNGSEGIELYSSSGTIIRDNTLRNNTYSGITLDSSDSNIIAGNTILLNNNIAIELYSSVSNSISGNIISNDTIGIGLFDGSTDNSIFNNTISYNRYVGVDVWRSGGNVIYHNNFIQNTPQVYSIEANAWDNGAEGNYWSDYEEKHSDAEEIDNSGIWNTPYEIDENNQDNYPLMSPFGAVKQPPVASFTYSPIAPIVNEPISFNASASYDLDGSVTWYEWNFGDGNYTVGTGKSSGFHTYTVAGTYTVTLTITDNEGATDTTTSTLTISPLPSDTTPPTISTASPKNKTYLINDVPLTFAVSKPTSWIGYSIDGQANVTVTENTTLHGLSDGSHSIIIYGEDTAGNTGASEMVYFTIETQQPELEPEPAELLQLWIVAIVVIAVVGVALMVYFLKKRKPPTPTAPPLPLEGTDTVSVTDEQTILPFPFPYFISSCIKDLRRKVPFNFI